MIPITRNLVMSRWIAGILVYGMLSSFSIEADPSPSTALESYRKGDFRGSEEQYSSLARETPNEPRLRFNAGTAAFRQKEFTNAATWFESVLGSPDLRLQQKAYYNLGNTRFQQGQLLQNPEERKQLWNEALTNFVSAMKLDAADTNASSNYAYVRQQLEQLERQIPPPQSGQNDKKDSRPEKKQQDQNDRSQDNGSNRKDQQSSKPEQQDNANKQSNSKNSGGESKPDSKNTSDSASTPGTEGENKDSSSQPQKQETQEGKAAARAQTGQMDGKEGQKSGSADATEIAEEKEGEMSASQAIQMLDGQKGDEKALLMRAYGNGKEAAERAARIRKPW